jgi:geranylgeranylglycerol-phosphate geranylgeranyltransferase
MSLGYLKLMRPGNCLMTAISIFVGGLIVSPVLAIFTAEKIWLAMLAGFLISGAGNAINDYVDVEADKINRPKRPIPSGRVSMKGALVFSVILFLIGIFLAGMINYVTFAIAIINSLLLVVYSTHLQNKMLLGNISISYLVASGFLFGGAALNNLVLPVLLALLAGLSNMAREIVKDLEDIEGDRKSFLKRIAKKAITAVAPSIAERFGLDGKTARLKHSTRTLSTLAVLFLLLAIIISPLPYIWGILGMSYLVVLALADIAFLAAAVMAAKATATRHYHRSSKMIKLGMFLGLVAFIVGALI